MVGNSLSAKGRKHVFKNRQPRYAELEKLMKSWVLEKRNLGHQVSGTSIMLEARRQAATHGYTQFKDSPKWVYSFMKRNGFVRRAITSTGQNLPSDWQEKAVSFREFVTRNMVGLRLHQIGNMGEVPVTFDLPSNFTIEKKGTSDVKISTTGHEKSKLQLYCV